MEIKPLKSELIIGAFAQAFPSDTGLYGAEKIDFEEVYKNLVIAPRFSLENNALVRHLISYCPVVRLNETGNLELLVYQRPDKKSGNTGEERLAGDISIGYGGHNEMLELPDDFMSLPANTTAIAIGAAMLAASLMESTGRELGEEIRQITLTTTVRFDELVIGTPVMSNVIIDNTNSVGLHHVGFVTIFRVPQGIDFTAGIDEETAITVKGWFSPHEAMEKFYNSSENWTKMLLSYLVSAQKELEQKYIEEDGFRRIQDPLAV